jgi:hypothetical protein
MTSAQSAAIKRIVAIIPNDWPSMTYDEQKAFLIGAASACYTGPTVSLLALLVPAVLKSVDFSPMPDHPSSPSLN